MKLEDIKPHQTWISLLGGALVLLFAGPALVGQMERSTQHSAAEIVAERLELQESATRFHDDMQLSNRPEGQMSADEITRLLAPIDRLQAVAGLERQAASAQLSHFTYALSPEQKPKTAILGANNLTESHITMSADAPLDTDVTAFIKSLNYVLPGRVRLQQFTLTRSNPDAALSLANVHMDAVVEWVSNGAAKDKVGK